MLPHFPTWFIYEPYGLVLQLEHLQQLPELLRETEDDYHSDTATEAGSYGG